MSRWTVATTMSGLIRASWNGEKKKSRNPHPPFLRGGGFTGDGLPVLMRQARKEKEGKENEQAEKEGP